MGACYALRMHSIEQANLHQTLLLLMWNDFQQDDRAELDRHDLRLDDYRSSDVLAVLHSLERRKLIEGDRFGDGATFRLTAAGRARARSLAAAKLGAMWALASAPSL